MVGKTNLRPYMADPITPDLEAKCGPKAPMKYRMEDMVLRTQANIVRALEEVDGKGKFQVDEWKREEGGGGVTCVMAEGNVFEKAGIAVSAVGGKLSPDAIGHMKDHLSIDDDDKTQLQFYVTGVSMVLHPSNPNCPTTHLNYRYFEVFSPKDKDTPLVWWFGGGADLTPVYLYEEDAVHFHKLHKEACDAHDSKFYPRFKKWCDEYFYLPHRHESRGVGGIFYDDLNEKSAEEIFAFHSQCAATFIPAYIPIVERRKDMPFTDEMKHWQQLQRGRYVEFNLVIDRGTKFGLTTPGSRVESILMTMPLTARWEYMHEPAPGTREAELKEVLQHPRNWV